MPMPNVVIILETAHTHDENAHHTHTSSCPDNDTATLREIEGAVTAMPSPDREAECSLFLLLKMPVTCHRQEREEER